MQSVRVCDSVTSLCIQNTSQDESLLRDWWRLVMTRDRVAVTRDDYGVRCDFRMISAACGNSFLAFAKKTPSATSSGVHPSLVLSSTRAPWSISHWTMDG